MDADERALLAAIIAHPDEDTPRLVYADWLQEHDQEERAQYIRLSIQLANLRYGDPDFEADEQRLSEERRLLVERYYGQWQRELTDRFPTNPYLTFVFKRGLAEQVRCSVRYFLEHSDLLFGAAPIRWYVSRSLTAATARRLIPSPAFQRLTGLRIFNQSEVLALLESPSIEIANLDFSHPVFFDSQLINHLIEAENIALRLAAHRGLRSVKRISLECCGIGYEGGLALAKSRYLELDVLNLLGNELSESVRQALRKRYGARVWLDPSDRNGFPRGG